MSWRAHVVRGDGREAVLGDLTRQWKDLTNETSSISITQDNPLTTMKRIERRATAALLLCADAPTKQGAARTAGSGGKETLHCVLHKQRDGRQNLSCCSCGNKGTAARQRKYRVDVSWWTKNAGGINGRGAMSIYCTGLSRFVLCCAGLPRPVPSM